MSELSKLLFFQIAKQHVTLYCNCTSRSSTKTGKFSFFFASTSHLFKILQPPIVINLLNDKIPNSSPFLFHKIQYHTRLISLDEDIYADPQESKATPQTSMLAQTRTSVL